jgi:antibiotic biosynthesis monooxygenase (ABM) superfamily enzyme
VVLVAFAFAVIFFAAWLVSPRLRAWIERPKYRFQENVQRYDREGRA